MPECTEKERALLETLLQNVPAKDCDYQLQRMAERRALLEVQMERMDRLNPEWRQQYAVLWKRRVHASNALNALREQLFQAGIKSDVMRAMETDLEKETDQ